MNDLEKIKRWQANGGFHDAKWAGPTIDSLVAEVERLQKDLELQTEMAENTAQEWLKLPIDEREKRQAGLTAKALTARVYAEKKVESLRSALIEERAAGNDRAFIITHSCFEGSPCHKHNWKHSDWLAEAERQLKGEGKL